ncbi:glycosyltransferase family 2 protein, partial [Falsirhodobacter sp. alg1]|uniref:glycosyltransferase family 2 protein n=1 Tax=Falsirhodobacter sp. alg1 TaxID=1472418 RepID=UPI001EDC49B3
MGGFDERFTGYGGEDTDFGKTLSMAGQRIGWIAGAKVYHQYHPHHMPPVHHLHSVVRNAELFAEKWGYRTMEHWLYA